MYKNQKNYKYRFLARIVIEAETPISVGSGERDIMTDHLVARDVNGLPYIPGTTIAGIVRHSLGEEMAKQFFGFNETKVEKEERRRILDCQLFKENINEGSQIIFSSAQIVGKDGKVVEGIVLDVFVDEYLNHFKNLPIRQHVRINEKGTAEKGGKFDEEVVYKGTRFCFEIEMLSEEKENEALFKNVLSQLPSDSLRIGSGTRSGHGEIKVVECKFRTLELTNPDNLTCYINKTSSLNDSFWNNISSHIEDGKNTNLTIYELKLKPEDFFLFGSGFGNDNADMTYVTEADIDWEETNPRFKEKNILIPGSSIKGALSHRVAFHYNKLNKWFVDNPDAKTGVDNEAVRALFGCADAAGNDMKRGNVLISDIIESPIQTKILNHVSIDRFTGGAIDGALFSEEVAFGLGQEYTLKILVHNDAFSALKVKEAFEMALTDTTTGMLPLGGGVNRGNGCFSGSWEITTK